MMSQSLRSSHLANRSPLPSRLPHRHKNDQEVSLNQTENEANHAVEDKFEDAQASIPSDQEDINADQIQARSTSKSPQPQFKSSLLSFLKQIASATGDLSQLTCPAVMLNGKSLLEYSAYWCAHPELLASIAWTPDPFDRMIATTKWFLSTLYGSYASRSDEFGMEKKPYNPILGERFFAYWNDVGMGDTWLVCEQVSHHPPISAFHLENKTSMIQVNGYNGQKTKFTGTAIRVQQIGQVQLLLPNFGEEIRVSYPELYLRGILSGSPFIELSGTCRLESSSGTVSEIEFVPKGWFSGEYHVIRGAIYGPKEAFQVFGSNVFNASSSDSFNIANVGHSNSSFTSQDSSSSGGSISFDNEILYLSGKWTGQILASRVPFDNLNASTSGDSQSHPFSFFDARTQPTVLPQIKSWEEQSELESLRVWHEVSEALAVGDFNRATQAKTRVEEAQRALRKQRANENFVWKPSFFMSRDEYDTSRASLPFVSVSVFDLDDSDNATESILFDATQNDSRCDKSDTILSEPKPEENLSHDISTKMNELAIGKNNSVVAEPMVRISSKGSRLSIFRKGSRESNGSPITSIPSSSAPPYISSSTHMRKKNKKMPFALLSQKFPWVFLPDAVSSNSFKRP